MLCPTESPDNFGRRYLVPVSKEDLFRISISAVNASSNLTVECGSNKENVLTLTIDANKTIVVGPADITTIDACDSVGVDNL